MWMHNPFPPEGPMWGLIANIIRIVLGVPNGGENVAT